MAQETYNKKINEFVDWVTGKSTITGDDITSGLPVSGARIRELLQQRLQMPCYLYENRQMGKYQLFASQEAQQIYAGGGHDELLLGEFDGPSAFKMVGKLITPEVAYLTSSSEGEELVRFVWSCVNSSDGTIQPVYTEVNVVIVNNGVKIWDHTEGINSSDQEHRATSDPNYYYEDAINILPYLQPGVNNVIVTLKSESTAAIQFKPTYNMINFSLKEENFNPFYPVTNSITLIPEFAVSIETTVDINVFIDGVSKISRTAENKRQYIVDTSDLTPGEHVVVMYLSCQIQSHEYLSNVIVKQFVKTITDKDDTNAYLAIQFDFANNSSTALALYKNKQYNLSIQQYSKLSLRWGIGNYASDTIYSKVRFYISDSADELVNEELISEVPDVAVNREGPALIEYAPGSTFDEKFIGYTIGASNTFHKILSLQVTPFIYASYITEAPSFSFKYDAFGKNNASDLTWNPVPTSTYDEIVCTPVGIPFQSTNGWYANSFRTKGVDSYLMFTNVPFDATEIRDRFTFEIDFLTEYIANTDECLVNIGNFIKIFPNRAQLLDLDGNKIIETNYRAGERVHLTFVKCPRTTEPSQWSDLYMIVTNGIFERASNANSTIANPTQTIKIGGAQSGIRVFGMRYYTTNLDWASCYNNWIYDSDNKADLVLRNMVFFTSGANVGDVEQSKCVGMMDTILVEGDLMQLVNKGVKLGMTVRSLKRQCPTDSTKNFTIYNCWVRTHGQSNIKYPVPSFKIWSNKTDNPDASHDPSLQPVLELEQISQQYCKARMQVYDGAVPANKWVLQSNFADSSCAHNGTFLRKWHTLTYNAKFRIGGKDEYKLRTPQQLFTSGETITPDDNGLASDTLMAHGYNDERKQWKDYSDIDFPYVIRQAPNSFPALLFFRANETDQWTFFGQYVFMDDKKTDYEYGERSIYQGFGDDTDPFVMCRRNIPQSDKNPDGQRPAGSEKYDKAKYRIWNNNQVVRIEMLDPDGNEVNFITEPQGCPENPYWIVWDQDRANRTANTSFEIIYPDIDDMTDAEVGEVYGKWLDFCRWVVSTKNNPAKFQAEAAAHLDLYKIAAYYVYYLFFGLVDSVNRNAQWKTYDGQHWWIEPWDMDIALGRKNDGGIAYDPPIDRQTPSATGDVGAFSGRDSVLWNHLEAWNDFMTAKVPAVVQALYEAGMTYDNMVDMLDNDYTLRWPEYIYNKSGEYKYIYSGILNEYVKPDYLGYLQGASVMQRHWWLSQSMDYWYSKFGRGAFRANYIKVDTNIPASGAGVNVTISPMNKAFFAYYFQEGGSPTFTVPGYDEHGLVDVTFNITESFSTKKPFYICGLTNMEELDISELGSGFNGINLNQVSEIHSIKVGATNNNGRLSFINGEAATFYEFSRATNIQKIDITGQSQLTVFTLPVTVTHFYAAASSFITGIYAKGNNFQELYLPNQHVNNATGITQKLQSLELEDCTWDTIKFFDTTNDAIPHTDIIPDPEGGEPTTRIYYEGDISEVDMTAGNPALNIQLLKLTGKTCSGVNANNSRDLVMKWIYSPYAMSLTSEQKVLALTLDHIEWTNVTKAQIQQLALFYKNRPNIGANLKGKITIAATETITQEDLAHFQEWFGPQVFTLGSAGIVIDYPLEVAVISVGSPAVYDNGHYDVDEADSGDDPTGVHIAISYVHFNLEPGGDERQWLFGIPINGSWIWETICVGHPNVTITGVHDVEAERWRYYLNIKESGLDVTEPYQFKIKVQGYAEEVLFIVDPATHTANMVLDNSSVDTVISDGTLLVRSGNSVGVINAVVGGTSQVTPQFTWSLSGLAATALALTSNGATATISPTAPVTDTPVSGNLNCQIYYPSVGNSVTISLPILIKEDQMIVDSSNLSLLTALNNAMGTQLTEMYASDVAGITTLTLENIVNYNAKTNVCILQYLTGLTNLTIIGGPLALQSILDDNLKAIYQPNLVTLSVNAATVEYVNLKQTNIQNFTVPNAADRTYPNKTGVKANSTARVISLDYPSNIDLDGFAGRLVMNSSAAMEQITIVNDTSVIYARGSAADADFNANVGWLGLIPANAPVSQNACIHISNSRNISAISPNQIEFVRLNAFCAAIGTLANKTFTSVGNITVQGYHKYIDDNLPSDIYDVCNFGGDYYVLYSNSGDPTQDFYTALNTWLDAGTHGDATPVNGDRSLGWTSQSLNSLSVIAQVSSYYAERYRLALSGISEVEFSVKKNKNATLVTEHMLNKYLTGFTTIDLTGSTADPKLNVGVTGLHLTLGAPTSVTIQGAGSFTDCVLTVVDASHIVNVNIANIYKTFSTIFGWNRTNALVGTITGIETVIAADKDTIIDGLTRAASNANIDLVGTINALGVVYLKRSVYNTLVATFTNLTLNVSVAFEAVDSEFQRALDYAGIMSESALNAYTWKTFWQAVYAAMPADNKNANFTALCNGIYYCPESCFMKAAKASSEKAFDLSLSISGLTEPQFTNLKLLCYAVEGGQNNEMVLDQSEIGISVPTGCYPKIIRQTTGLDGVLLIQGSVKAWKWNDKFTMNTTMIVNGKYGSELTTGHKYLAMYIRSSDSTQDAVQTTADGGVYMMPNNDADWPFRIYKMMYNNITGKTLADWFNNQYTYRDADFQ